MQRVRLTIFWMHLFCGVIVGLFVSYFAVTGALLAFEHPILRHLELSFRVAASGPRLPLDSLLKNTERMLGPIDALTVMANPQAPVEVQIGRDRVYAVNPYTGEILGRSAPAARRFFSTVTGLHRWFGASSAHHEQARTLKGIVTSTFMFLILSGVYLWLPRKWSRQRLKHGLFLRSGVSGRARDWNWHNVLGIWVALPLATIAASGLVMTYPCITRTFFPAPATVHAQLDAASPHRAIYPHKHGSDSDPALLSVSLDLGLARVQQQDPVWQSISLRIPQDQARQLNFTVDRGMDGEPVQRDRVSIDASTGAVTRWEPFAAQDAQTRFRNWARFLHTGEIAGMAGEMLAALVCAATLLIVWTGYAMAVMRLRLRWAASAKVVRKSDFVPTEP